MKSKEDIDFKSIELDICYSDLTADSKLRTLASKNSLVISIVVSLLAVVNLLFRVYNVYDIIPASFVTACMILLTIIVLFINDYLFNKNLRKIIAYRYLDRAIYKAMKEYITKDTENKGD